MKDKLNKFKNIIKETVLIINNIVPNFELYYQLNIDLMNNYNNKIINYSILQNMEEIMKYINEFKYFFDDFINKISYTKSEN